MKNGKRFFECYAGAFADNPDVLVLDIGAQDVNGTLKQACPPRFRYLGVDSVPGTGVDVVLEDPYVFPFETGSADIVVSSSCFEHAELFWLVFLEVMRVLKPRGLFYLNAPSNGIFHRYPVDCWRFYPDSGRALVTWARRNGMNAGLLESFVSRQVEGTQVGEQWSDFVAVFVREAALAFTFPERIIDTEPDIFNGTRNGSDEIIRQSELTEDQIKIALLSEMIRRSGKG